MARYTDSVCRQCRREGTKLFLKGDRCYNEAKCAVMKRHTPPGQHGQARARKASEYGTQLREKQKETLCENALQNRVGGDFGSGKIKWLQKNTRQ